MPTPTQPWLRRLLPWLQGGLWVLLTAVAFQPVASIKRTVSERVADTVDQRVRGAVDAWEERLTSDLVGALEDATPDRASELQARWRARGPLSAIYLWSSDRDVRGRDAQRLLFPSETSVERDDAAARAACAAAARSLARAGAPALDIASAWQTGCARAPEPVRLYAADQAATYLELDGQLSAAASVLEAAIGPDPGHLASDRGMPPQALARIRQHAASLLQRAGRADDAAKARLRLAEDMALLDAPDAAALTAIARSLVTGAREHGGEPAATAIEEALAPAERRIAAWKEVRQRVLADPPAPSSTPVPRFSRDQYSDAPFVLFTRWNADGSGGAIQLEMTPLVESLLRRPELADFRAHLVVTQDQGDVVAGSRGPDPIAVEVVLWRTLQWLRLGVREGALRAEVAASRPLWIGPGLLVGATSIIGLAALWYLARASAQERALLARQRDFSTRVTHELKTPLAGIRVMAENLAMGAATDEAQRADMASGIIRETDRLTRRVDEILAVAREVAVPDPKPFDPEEIVLLAVDEWGPRLDAAGVRLVAEDLDPVRQVLGDPTAIRDAIACLLDNALKYRREDRDDATVWLRLTDQGSDVQIEVSDNGIGVPATHRKAIFEPFVRVEGEGRGRAGGYGLGLAQVADIARVHGGSVRCDDGNDGGARFTLRLPAAPGS